MTLEHEAMRALVARATGGDKTAVEAVVTAIQDDLYNLCFRMLGSKADAEDACQEVLIQIVTHLAQWRGEASFRTWSWRIATRHVLRRKKSRDEEECSFEAVEGLIEAGRNGPPMPDLEEHELGVLEDELRLACTQAMLLSIDRDHRAAFLLDKLFDLESPEAAEVLEIEPAAYRKRLSRARERVSGWMGAHCGIVEPLNDCNCRRQIPIALQVGAVRPGDLVFATHPTRADDGRRRLAIARDTVDTVERAASTLCCHPDYVAPASMAAKIIELIDRGVPPTFDA